MPVRHHAADVDVTRNGDGDVMLVINLPVASLIGEKDALLLLRPNNRQEDSWTGLIKDKMSAEAGEILVPNLTPEQLAWLKAIPVVQDLQEGEEKDPLDHRRPGNRYALIVEMMSDEAADIPPSIVAGYAARVVFIN